MSATALIAANAAQADSSQKEVIIDRPDFISASGVFDIDALEALGRVSGPVVSPDGKSVLFGISYESLEHNRSNNDLYTIGVDGSALTRITHTAKSEANAVWINGGSRIAFLYPDSDGAAQLWVMNADGSGRTQLTEISDGVDGFLFSPDQSKILFIKSVKYTYVFTLIAMKYLKNVWCFGYLVYLCTIKNMTTYI